MISLINHLCRLNVLAGEKQGFVLGKEITGCTRGLWAWFPAKLNPPGAAELVMLLDTEGLGDTKRADPTFDVQVFAFANLLSSCVCGVPPRSFHVLC